MSVNPESTALIEITPRVSPQPLVRIVNGGQLRTGNPGNKGRTPEAFKVWMRSLASSEQVQRGLETILADSSNPMFMAALKHVTERGYGKPKEMREVTGAELHIIRIDS